MKKTHMINFVGGKILDHYYTPEVHIDRCLTIVLSALEGTLVFCYGLVKSIELYGSGQIKAEIQAKRIELEDVHYSNAEVYRTRTNIKSLKDRLKELTSFDQETYDRLKSNHKSLKQALDLLRQEGYITSYVLKSSGYLVVNWFETYQGNDIQIIEYGIYRPDRLDGYEPKSKQRLAEDYERELSYTQNRGLECIDKKEKLGYLDPGHARYVVQDTDPGYVWNRDKIERTLPRAVPVNAEIKVVEPEVILLKIYFRYLMARDICIFINKL